MRVSSTTLIYFSPTRTTRRILEAIAQGMAGLRVDHLDLTPPDAPADGVAAAPGSLALVGAPVYGGRIPAVAADRLRRVRGDGAPAVLVVAYGNRAYEDALLELRDLVFKGGFRPIAAGAFIGEHSFSGAATPIASGRPDPDDLTRARAFGALVWQKLGSLPARDRVPLLRIPGDVPYKESRVPAQIPPVRDEAACVLCGACVAVCPMGAISIGATVVTDSSKCIVCCACVKQCPEGARAVVDARIRAIAQRLTLNCQARREPETYFLAEVPV